MSINTVTTDDLRQMNGKEGLVVQGCGGDPQEWLDGINGLLTDEGILKNGSKFENISVFQNGSLTNILFPFEDGVEIDMGKLAMWRLHSHEQFGGTWLSDYVPNRLGGFITEHEPDKIKPDCRLIGEDGNIFNLMGLATRTLRHNGLAEQCMPCLIYFFKKILYAVCHDGMAYIARMKHIIEKLIFGYYPSLVIF